MVAYPDEGAVYPRQPRRHRARDGASHGLRNPQELAFDEHGNLFTGDNDSDQGDQERLVYLVEGGDSGWRIGYQHAPLGKGGPWMSEGLWKPRFAQRPAYLLPPICNIEDGPSGLTYYPGTGLTPEYAGHFFITHFKGSIARSGIQTYTVQARTARPSCPPAASSSSAACCPPTSPLVPDGVLYLSDWVDGWPKSNKGRIYGITPVNSGPGAGQGERRSRQTTGGRIHAAHAGGAGRRCSRIPTAARGSRRSSSWRRAATERRGLCQGGRRHRRPRRWRGCTPCGA